MGLYLRGNLPVKLFFFFCQFPKMDFIMTSVHKWVCIIECAIFLYKCNLFYFLYLFCLLCVTLVRVTDHFFRIYPKASLNIWTTHITFVTTSVETIFLMSASICACLREQYLLLLYNAYYYWTMACRYLNISCPDILFSRTKELVVIQ